MRYSTIFLIAAFIIILAGCSGGGSPVSPDVTAQGTAGGPEAAAAGHHVWGLYDFQFDLPSNSFRFAPSRQSLIHMGITDFTGLPAGDLINIDFAGIDPENRILKFDISFTNPFPNISARDVRGIIIGNHPGYYLINADGATNLFDDDGDVTINTFIAYAKDQPNRIFAGGVSYTERYELHYPPGADFRALKLAVDASYPDNCREPYGFSAFSFDRGDIAAGVLDWQDDVDGMWILAESMGGGADIPLEYDEFDGTWRGVFSETPDGFYRVLDAEFIGRFAADPGGLIPETPGGMAEMSGGKLLRSAQVSGSGLSDVNDMENADSGDPALSEPAVVNPFMPESGIGASDASGDGDIISRICFIRADSGNHSLWGLVRVRIEQLPLDPIAQLKSAIKMSKSLLEDYYDPAMQDEYVPLIAYVAGTPVDIYARIKNDADAAYPEIDTISEEIKEAYRCAQPELSRFADEYGDAFAAGDSAAVSLYHSILDRHGAGRAVIEPKTRQLESLKERRGEYVALRVESEIAPLQLEPIKQVSAIEDTSVTGRDFYVNVIFIDTKVKQLGRIAALDTIEYLERDTEPELQMNTAHISVNAPTMWGAGYTGGTFDVEVIDTGIDFTHPALMGHYFDPEQNASFGGACSPDDDNNWGSASGHGTHCAGIVASMDASYKGTGTGLDRLYNGKICPPAAWASFTAARDWGGMGGTVSDPSETISLSWAIGPTVACVRDGNYYSSRYMDNTAYIYGQLWSIAAGNFPSSICSDDNMITNPSDAYNILGVGAMYDYNNTSRADDVIAGFSRLGPGITPGGETRVKPDIAAPGQSIMSCAHDWEGANPDFVSKNGTSMAAPNAAGACALVMDAGLVSGLEVRAMLSNTAEDWNSNLAGPGSNGPDNWTGYGYMNLATTLTNLGNIVADTITEGETRFYRHSSPAATNSVMVLWDRYVSGATEEYPDIDLEMWDDTTNIMIGSQDKTYDNKRFLYTGTTNDVVYKIDARYIPVVSPTWNYVITATGGTLSGEMFPGSIDPVLGFVEPMPVAVEVDITATITNNGDFTLRDVQGTLTLDTDMTFESGSVPTQTGAAILNPTQSCVITWHVKLNMPSLTPKHIMVDTAATAYGEAFTGFAEDWIDVIPPDPELLVYPTSLDFGIVATVKPFYIENTGGGTLTWSIDDSGFPTWLQVNDNGDTTQDETDVVQVIVNRDGLVPTVYAHDIDVVSDGGDDTVHVAMIVPDPGVPIINIDELDIYFGEVDTQRNVVITNIGGGVLHWQIDHAPPNEYPPWLETNIDAGIVDEMHPQGGVIITVDRTGLAPGLYTYDMNFTSDGGDLTVHIFMSVHVPLQELDINLSELDFGEVDIEREFIVSNVGEPGSTLNWSIPIIGKPAWLNLSMYSDSIGTGEISLVKTYVDRAGFDPGHYQFTLQVSSDGGNSGVVVHMDVPDIDPLAPILVSPMDGVHYEVCAWLAFTWDGVPGYDGKFWFDTKLNGQPFGPFSNMPIVGNSITLPPELIDTLAKYGTWEWRVSIIETPSPMTQHFSPWWTLYKDRPELLTPPDDSVVSDTTVFTWNKVLTANDPRTVYVAKVRGFEPIDPLYAWWNDTDTAALPPNWFQLLQNLGKSTTYTWTIAAVCEPKGGMTLEYAEAVRYPSLWTFHLP